MKVEGADMYCYGRGLVPCRLDLLLNGARVTEKGNDEPGLRYWRDYW